MADGMRSPMAGLRSPFGRRRVADTTAPAITSQSYDEPTNKLTAEVGEGGTVYALWSASAVLSDAAIQAGATVVQAYAAGVNYITVDDTGLAPGTWHLQWGVEDAADNFTQGAPVEKIVPIPGFTETWAGFTAGNGNAQIDAGGYALGSGAPTCTIVADASAPSGKALHLTGASSSVRYIARDDVAAAIAAGGAYTDVLILLRTSAASGARGAVGFAHDTSTASGLIVRRVSAGTEIALSTNLDPNTTPELVLASAIADDSLRWVRLQFYGTDKLRGKVWAGAVGDEPGAWSADVAAAAAWAGVMTRLDLIGRTATATNLKILGYSVAIGGAAPGF